MTSIRIKNTDSSVYETNIENKIIDENKFYNNKLIKNIRMPANSVEEISKNAFYGCINLKTIDLPNSLKKIGEICIF